MPALAAGTTGKRKGDKVMGGMADYFGGRLFFEGVAGRLNATRYCAFLDSWVLILKWRLIALVKPPNRNIL